MHRHHSRDGGSAKTRTWGLRFRKLLLYPPERRHRGPAGFRRNFAPGHASGRYRKGASRRRQRRSIQARPSSRSPRCYGPKKKSGLTRCPQRPETCLNLCSIARNCHDLRSSLLAVTPRHGRRVVSSLVEKGVLVSAGPRDPLRLAFPAALAGRWMPGLFRRKRALTEGAC